MYQKERIQKIQELLLEKQSLTKNDIMAVFNISSDTARRDILKVIKSGLAERTHGGIILADNGNQILNFFERSNFLLPEKTKMAKKVLDYLPEESICFLDVSTTLALVAQNLRTKCKIYTHSLDNAFSLAVNPQVETILFGGTLDLSNRFFFRPQMLDEVGKYKFDYCFIGAASIEKDGIYYKQETDALVKRAIIQHSRQTILVSECQKFKKKSSYLGAKLEDIDVLITDRALKESEKAYFKSDIELIY